MHRLDKFRGLCKCAGNELGEGLARVRAFGNFFPDGKNQGTQNIPCAQRFTLGFHPRLREVLHPALVDWPHP